MADADAAGVDLRALDLFGRLAAHPGNARFRQRLLKRETDAVLTRLARLEAGHRARAAMPTELPGQAEAALDPPARIGPFRLTAPIGRGGMGEVWRAERDDGLFEQVVAVKLIRASLDARAADAFAAERRILARLDHPDIVRLIDGGITDHGVPYLIMEYVDGAPFDEAVAPLGRDSRIRLFAQAAGAVQFAHGKLVAHGDLKPSNILVDREGRVRLLDFGIAELLGADHRPGAAQGAMTLAFASPQRRAGAAPSIADDVYALGKLLALIAGDPVPADLAAIVTKATAGDEAVRYPAVGPLIADLDAWQAGRPVSAQPDTLRYRTARFVARNRAAVTAATLAVLALIATTVVATLASIRAERARAEAVARYDDAHGIANYLIFDVMHRLERQPHSFGLRLDLVRTAQAYLDRLARLPTADAATRLDTARALLQLADYQGKIGVPNLDQPDRARANMQRAGVLLRGLHSLAADAVHAQLLIDRAGIASNTDNDLALADRLLAAARPLVLQLAAREPALRADWQHRAAIMQGWHGDFAAQYAMAAAGLALPPPRDVATAMLWREKFLGDQIEAAHYLHRDGEALTLLPEQLRLAEALHRRAPEDRVAAILLIDARIHMGGTLDAVSRVAEGLPYLERAASDGAALVALEPDDLRTVAEWRSAQAMRAQALGSLGRVDEALAIDRQLAAQALTGWQQQPDDTHRLRQYLQALLLIGEVEHRNGRTADGCATDRRTLALYDRLRAEGRLTRFDAESANLRDLTDRMAAHCAAAS